MIYDKDIREPLYEYLESVYGKSRIFEEKRMGHSRADVVMVVPDGVFGIEIKSDADTYARLERQVKDYSLYYDYNMVVVGSSHAAHIQEHVPEDWGILSVEETQEQTLDFYEIRKPVKNPNMDWRHKLSILWRPELAHIQEINQLPAYKGKSKLFVIEKIIEKMDPEILLGQVSEELFERDYTTIAEEINAYRVANGQKKRRNVSKRKRKYKRIL